MHSDSHPILAREGWWHVGVALLAVVLATAWVGLWAMPIWLVAAFVVQFFRDPHRTIPTAPNAVVAPADGKIVAVVDCQDPYLDRPARKISVFMNVFSVHSNRAPVAGEIRRIWYTPGKFVNASLDKASSDNERNALWIRDVSGRDIVCVQIAGLVARRILCHVDIGDTLARGERYGFIRFGSRVDVYLPREASLAVRLGEWVSAGSGIIATLPGN